MTGELIGKQIPVLDKGYVQLLDFMPHPSTGVSGDLAIVNAARVSFMGDSKGTARDKKLLFYLLRHRHTSPFEQVEFKFRVRAPVVTWWQWVRHRTWNFNAQSGRYTPFQENDFYEPDIWRKQAADNKQASAGELTSPDADELSALLTEHYEHGFALYQKALEMGVAREQARIFLSGFAVYYTWVAKIDAHNLMHFLSLRIPSDAQYEIRAYAQTIFDEFFKPLMPDRKSTRLNSSHTDISRMPSSA